MIPDLPGALLARVRPVRRHRGLLGGRALEVNVGRSGEPTAALELRSDRRQHPGGERRIEKDQIERPPRRAEKVRRIGADDAPVAALVAVPLRQASFNRACGAAVAFDERHVCRAARERFEAECAASGEQIQAARTGHCGRKPVEQRLADTVGRGADGGRIWKAQPPPSPRAADDTQHPRGAAAPVRLGRNAQGPSFEPADRAATIH